MKFYRLFLLLVCVFGISDLIAQHLLIHDSLTGKQFRIKLDRTITVKEKGEITPVKGALYDIDDSGLCIGANRQKWINFEDIEFISYREKNGVAAGFGVISGAIGITITGYLLSKPASDAGDPSKTYAVMLAPVFIIGFPLLISFGVKSGLPVSTFFIGRGSSVTPVRKQRSS